MLAAKIVFIAVEAVCDQTASEPDAAVLDELGSMLERYLLTDEPRE